MEREKKFSAAWEADMLLHAGLQSEAAARGNSEPLASAAVVKVLSHDCSQAVFRPDGSLVAATDSFAARVGVRNTALAQAGARTLIPVWGDVIARATESVEPHVQIALDAQSDDGWTERALISTVRLDNAEIAALSMTITDRLFSW